MQDINIFKEELFSKAKNAGFSEFEIYLSNSATLEITLFESQVDTYNMSENIGVGFRGIYNGKMGYSYSEKIDIDIIEELINGAKDSAESIESDDIVEIFGGSGKYSEFDNYNTEFEEVSVQDKIKYLLEVEKWAKGRDKRVRSIGYNLFEQGSSEKTIMNSKGLNKSFKSNSGIGYLELIVEDNGDVKTADEIKISSDFKDYSSEAAKEYAYKIVDEAISMLGAKPVKSGDYKIVLRNTAAATLLKTFLSIFSAESVQKGLSLLKGKVGNDIANKKVSIVDDPLLENGLVSTPFDDEGVATYKKDIIRNGSLVNLLYNLKCAKKDNVKSTGNARKGYKSSVGISAYNMYIETGNVSYNELIKTMDTGLIITDLQGLHSGANPISGDFSLSAQGYFIENGEISFPVEQITISGNFYNVLNDIEEIANDLKFAFPSGANVGSPSLLIKNLKVAGE